MAMFRWPRPLILAVALLFGAAATVAYAQLTRAPEEVDRSGSFEVGGIDVDVTAKTALDAQQEGWKLAQRKGWAMLSQRMKGSSSSLSDGALDSIVTGIVVEREEFSANRYIARLGVLFSRAKAGAILGVKASYTRSAPMLLMPLQWSGGAGTAYEQNTPWRDAWSRFRTGNSRIDYVRLSGTGPDSLLLNAGQVTRRGRSWWRAILNQYRAADVLIPQVRLYRQWPGGPVLAQFTAGYGPDNRILSRFTLRVESGDGLDALLDAGIKRIDKVYENALNGGVLKPDPLLAWRPPVAQPVDDSTDGAGDADTSTGDATGDGSGTAPPPAPTTTTISVQYDSPSASAVGNTEASLRGIPGVSSAATTSMALGGISVMRVEYAGNIANLAAALQSRGWQVAQGAGTLRISRRNAVSSPSSSGGDQSGGNDQGE